MGFLVCNGKNALPSIISLVQSGPQKIVSGGCKGSGWFKVFQVFSDITVTSVPVSYVLSTLNVQLPKITTGILYCIKVSNVFVLLNVLGKRLSWYSYDVGNGI